MEACAQALFNSQEIPTESDERNRALFLNEQAAKRSGYSDAQREGHPDSAVPWRISPSPFAIAPGTCRFLHDLGDRLLAFYRASNKLYLESVKGSQPAWVHQYLDMGKPQSLIEFSRMNRMKDLLPAVIRPDIILAESGPMASELDSIPGGIGTTASLAHDYHLLHYPLFGGSHGMIKGFERMIRSQTSASEPVLAIVISEEAASYRPEMIEVARSLNENGLESYVIAPQDVEFTEEALFCEGKNGRVKIDVIYRFFELFDLKNIPKAELMLYAVKKQKVAMTPPIKPHLEEKMLFAFFHHPLLQRFWLNELGEETYHALRHLIPQTWILDPKELPPYAVIPDLEIEGQPISSWRALLDTTKKQRPFVAKASGFSEIAWGSKSVSFAHDLSNENWGIALTRALESFPQTPYILQRFYKSYKFSSRYYDFASQSMRNMSSRLRLCPYYFVVDGQTELGGALSTLVSAEKKAIHGMSDGIMTATMVREGGTPIIS